MDNKIQEPMAHYNHTHYDCCPPIVPKNVDDNSDQDWPYYGHEEAVRPGKIWGWKNLYARFNIIDVDSAVLKFKRLKPKSQYIVGVGENDWRPKRHFIGGGLSR